MSNTKHTPRKWEKNSEPTFDEKRHLWICNVGTIKGKLAEVTGTTKSECQANTKLIAAAPIIKTRLAESIALVRLKYGNSDPDVWKFIEETNALLATL